MEILDVSKNKIREIPDEISNLTSLKVLAIQRNRIERLPVCLGDISSLHMLKLDGNPIVFPPPEVCSIKDRTPTPSGDNERDALITTQVKRYLRQVATRERLKVESEGDSRYAPVMFIRAVLHLLTLRLVRATWKHLVRPDRKEAVVAAAADGFQSSLASAAWTHSETRSLSPTLPAVLLRLPSRLAPIIEFSHSRMRVCAALLLGPSRQTATSAIAAIVRGLGQEVCAQSEWEW